MIQIITADGYFSESRGFETKLIITDTGITIDFLDQMCKLVIQEAAEDYINFTTHFDY